MSPALQIYKDVLHDSLFLTANARVNSNSFFINALDMNNVNIGLEESLDCSAASVFTNWDTTEDPSHLDAVTRLGNIDEVIKDTHGDRVRGLPVRDFICRDAEK
jgi:hypothetical protein